MALPKKKPVVSALKPERNSYSGWKPRVTVSTILVCKTCKVKYIKTREPQVTCVKCMSLAVVAPVFRLRDSI